MARPPPRGQPGLLDLPDEVLIQILCTMHRQSEAALRIPPSEYAQSLANWPRTEESAHSLRKLLDPGRVQKTRTLSVNVLLPLREVCRGLCRAVDLGLTYLRVQIRHRCGSAVVEFRRRGAVEFPKWRNLSFLSLDHSCSRRQFSVLVESLAASCPNLQHLQVLAHWGASHTPCVQQLAPLTSLSSLYFEGSSDPSEVFPPFPRLTCLRLVTDSALTLGAPPALEELAIQGQETRDYKVIPVNLDCLSACSRLRQLVLSSEGGGRLVVVAPTLPKSLQSLSLRELSLRFGLRLGEDLPNLSELRLVSLSGDFTHPTGPDLPSFLSKGTLQSLHLEDLATVNLEGVLPLLVTCQSRLTSLTLGDLSGPSLFRFPGPLSLTKLTLMSLSLSHLDVTGLTSLSHLHVAECYDLMELTGLNTVASLEALYMYRCPNLAAVEGLLHLPCLQSVELWSLTSVKELALSYCPLTRPLHCRPWHLYRPKTLKLTNLKQLQSLTIHAHGNDFRTLSIAGGLIELHEFDLDLAGGRVGDLHLSCMSLLAPPGSPLPVGIQSRTVAPIGSSHLLCGPAIGHTHPLQSVELTHCHELKHLSFAVGGSSLPPIPPLGRRKSQRLSAAAKAPVPLESSGHTPIHVVEVVDTVVLQYARGISEVTLPPFVTFLRVSWCGELEELNLASVEKLEELEVGAGMASLRVLKCAPFLQKLKIISCPMIEELRLAHLPGLKVLQVEKLASLRILECGEMVGTVNAKLCPKLRGVARRGATPSLQTS